MNQRVVFVRTGWMQWYGCTPGSEDIAGGGAWNVDNIGYEFENFRNYNGKCYGYAYTGHTNSKNLERVAPRAQIGKANTLDNVLVIIIAGSPQFIIGWFNKATLFRNYPDEPDGERRGNFEADAKDCVLLPSSFRSHAIPKGQGAFGQANIYYLFEADGTPRTGEWIAKAIEYVQNYAGPNLVEDPRLEFGEFAHRHPTWKERLTIAGASIDKQIEDGEDVESLVDNIDVDDEYTSHVDHDVWPHYREIQNLLKQKKDIEAVKLFGALLVDDDGQEIGWNGPYRLTADGQNSATLFCNGIPMIPAPELSALMDQNDNGVWKCAFSGRVFAIEWLVFWLLYRELIDPFRMNVAKKFVKSQLEETDLELRLTDASAKEHLDEYCTPNMTAHVDTVKFPEYQKIHALLAGGAAIAAYTLYQKMMVDDEGEVHDFDEAFYVTATDEDSPTVFFNAIPMIPREEKSGELLEGEDEVFECAVTHKFYAVTFDPLSSRNLNETESDDVPNA